MQLQIDKLGKVAVTVEQSYWSNEKDYDRLTIVEAPKGEYKTYISRKPVPAGTVLTNREYWIPFSSLKEEIVIDFNEFVASLTEAMQQTKDYADDAIEQGIEDITAIKEEAIRIITYIADNGIDSTVLAPNSVTSEKIKAGNVLSKHIGAGEVKSANIGAGEVKSGNIGEGEVKSTNIGTGEVKSGNIGEEEVKEGHIAPGAITTEKLATPVITQLQTIMDDAPTPNSEKPVNSSGVFNSVIGSGVFDLSTHTGDTYANLSAALTAMNALSNAYKKGGMSIKYVQTSDNKYVQYRLMNDEFSITESDWQGVANKIVADSKDLLESGVVERSTVLNNQLSSVFYITDSNGNIVAKIDKDGVHSVDFKIGQDSSSVATALGNIATQISEAVNAEKASREESDSTLTSLITAEEDRAKRVEDEKLNVVLSDYAFYFTDTNGYVIAKIDANGVHSVNIDETPNIINDSELKITDINGYIIAKIDANGVHSAKDKYYIACLVIGENYYPISTPTRDSDGNVIHAEVKFATGINGNIEVSYVNGYAATVDIIYGNYTYKITINRDAEGNVITVVIE